MTASVTLQERAGLYRGGASKVSNLHVKFHQTRLALLESSRSTWKRSAATFQLKFTNTSAPVSCLVKSLLAARHL